MLPKVSVIIPTKNRSHLLKKAISSVLKQTYKNLECIVVDDNSADKTKKIVNNIDDRRLSYFCHKTNKLSSVSSSYATRVIVTSLSSKTNTKRSCTTGASFIS